MFGDNKLSTWDDLRPCILRGWASSDLFKAINLSSFLGIKFFKDSMEILCQTNSTGGASQSCDRDTTNMTHCLRSPYISCYESTG